jgi:HK97 family phage prohead protease
VILKTKMLDAYMERRKGFEIDSKSGLLVRKSAVSLDDAELTRPALFSVKATPAQESAADPAKAKLWIAGVANAHEKDRMEEVLRPTGVMLSSYSKNPILLYQHRHDCPIGSVPVMRVEDSGVLFEAWVGDPEAGLLTKLQEDVRSLVAQRVLKAVSVGFIPHKIRMPSYDMNGAMVEPATIEEWEMLELSIVSVPCNAGALFEEKQTPEAEATRKVWSFPTLGADGKFVITPQEKKMDPLLKELLEKQLVTLNGLAVSMNTLTAGMTDLKTVVDAAKKEQPAPAPAATPEPTPAPAAKADGEEDDEEKEDDDEADDKTGDADARLKAVETGLAAMQDNVTKLVDTVTLLVKKINGDEEAAA